MTTTIFTVAMAQDAFMGVQVRKILLFVDNSAAYPQDMSFLRHIKVAYYPSKCTSMLQPLNLNTLLHISNSFQEAPSKKGCVHDGHRKERKTKNQAFARNASHGSSLAISNTVKDCELILSVQLWM
jgi:hypothetical protein